MFSILCGVFLICFWNFLLYCICWNHFSKFLRHRCSTCLVLTISMFFINFLFFPDFRYDVMICILPMPAVLPTNCSYGLWVFLKVFYIFLYTFNITHMFKLICILSNFFLSLFRKQRSNIQLWHHLQSAKICGILTKMFIMASLWSASISKPPYDLQVSTVLVQLSLRNQQCGFDFHNHHGYQIYNMMLGKSYW